LEEVPTLGRRSDGPGTNLPMPEEAGFSVVDRDTAACCWATEEGFLRRTFREDLPFSSGLRSEVALLEALPKPNVDDVVLIGFCFISGKSVGVGAGSRNALCGNPVGCVRFKEGWPRRVLIWVGTCVSFPLRSILSGPVCIYVPNLLPRVKSSGLLGGSKSDWYDAIVSLYLNITLMARCW
jgi:hypothetical protein